MHRLFVAIRPPIEIREPLLSLMHGVEGARWQDDAQLHLTLCFLGEIEAHAANDVAAALNSVRKSPFDLQIGGVGVFERKGKPTTLWAGVNASQPLLALETAVARQLRAAGVPPQPRQTGRSSQQFRPHITLARFARAGTGLAEFLIANANLASAPFRVGSFGLYESEIGADGARYTQVAQYRLFA